MAILARILMLVACVPLLQPTGFCACKAGKWLLTPPHPELATATSPAPVTTQQSRCCPHRNVCVEGQKAAPPGPDRPAPCPTPGDDHLPGCPASAGVDRFKWVEPAQLIVQDVPMPDVNMLPPLEILRPTVLPVLPVADWPSSPPIYISHCSLVI